MFTILTPRILLLRAIFSRSVLFATAQPRAYCSHDSVDQHTATLADCYAAIDMIPPGGYAPAPPQVTNQPGIRMPQHVRDPKRFYIPVSFWSGTCEVRVACSFPDVSTPRFPPGADFASFQHNTMWPNARRMARRIVDKCFPTSKTGFDEGSGTIAFEAITPLQSRIAMSSLKGTGRGRLTPPTPGLRPPSTTTRQMLSGRSSGFQAGILEV